MSGNTVRVPIEQAKELQLANIHIIGAVGRHDDDHRYVELMSDLQQLPVTPSSDAHNSEGAPNLLLVEIDDPNDSECLRSAVETLSQLETFEQRGHHFKQF
ncbi:hypothetical protein MHM84_01345 [Halomonas sp. McH1-25]|uniref:hypothetical protein n=1 Tax=unclassified Halomonas TaxID=2609666 RepID=UPI001EF49C01|nr:MULTISPECIES: hypothetical protein [unclassified Halomonas]MCG7598426.1 hypothetical protein [Halomonas sp. McH1-25]MCP1343762.1 hypothetical protein [Halomonas sp. FL8]MCP1361741.1 hypothetical protein [Halomonas sp. BBD45]MCP1366445.1 hypothetical protein [Halomonas sp. BBD48]